MQTVTFGTTMREYLEANSAARQAAVSDLAFSRIGWEEFGARIDEINRTLEAHYHAWLADNGIVDPADVIQPSPELDVLPHQLN